MENQKQNGSYYTSPLLANFIVKHIFEHYVLPKKVKILEPSCGDGIFIEALLNHVPFDSISELTLVEKSNLELEKALKITQSYNPLLKVNSFNTDFLEFQEDLSERYNLIIGNPPYIKKVLLSKRQRELCHKIHQNAELSSDCIKNIWTSFLLTSIKKLDENSVICLVLPAELLQVKYAKEIRKYLLDSFNRIEIFAFNELIFEKIEQDVIVLIASKEAASNGKDGISFYQVNKLEDLQIPQFIEKNSNVHRKTLDKWTNYLLEDEELNFIDDIRRRLMPIEYYCEKIGVGIVTAANSYFIVNDDKVDEYQLHSFSDSILSKSSDISGIIDITNEVISDLKQSNKKTNLITFPNVDIEEIDQSARKYIDYGESLDLDKRYKCKQRTNWYSVPYLWKCDGFFGKRAHKFPRVILNSAKINVTDSFYRINIKEEYDIKSLVFSFYNSLCLVLAELEGRYYGGGVLELTPNEFKKISLPYCENITNEHFLALGEMLKSEQNICNILNYTDNIILKENIGLEEHEIEKLRQIREKLVARRLKSS
ncbi:N-6 DNA methylase [Methanolobus sp.]|uniref:Eco57I restriction-modification methylase domain-containing protein n=1 Tax=Methanolobus sp. TaxID=1874737 RepID=UPI0025D45D5B|nr:N-6 DNA methylase [Methanolobus sp.]